MIVSTDGGDFPWQAQVAVTPTTWHGFIGNVERSDILDLHLVGHFTGTYTIRISAIRANPAVQFRLRIVANSTTSSTTLGSLLGV